MIAVHCWSATRTLLRLRKLLLQSRPKRLYPKLLSIRLRERPHDLFIAAIAHADHSPFSNRGRTVSSAESADSPREWGTTFGPFLQEARFFGVGISIGTLPLRPIGRCCA